VIDSAIHWMDSDFLTAVKNAQKCIKIIANEELN
jgi:hypothetical protein